MLATFQNVRTTDYDELTAAEEGWEVQHRPTRPQQFEGRLSLARIGSIAVDIEWWSTAMELSGTSPRQALSFVLPLEDKRYHLSSDMKVAADRIDVFGPDCEVYAVTQPNYASISCQISMEALDERADSPASAFLAEMAQGHRVISSTQGATDKLRRSWKRLLDLTRRGTLSAINYDRLVDDFLLALARALSSPKSEPATRASRRCRLAHRARDFMLERSSDPPSIAEVCRFLHTSERTLQYAFSNMYGVAPKRYLKTQRLIAARQALRSATPSARVCDIAMDLGFWDLGYFAKEYQKMFGELPSTTVASQ